MVSLHHELGWVIDFQDFIDDLWTGKITNLTDESWPRKKIIGYVENGKEVLFNDERERIYVS